MPRAGSNFPEIDRKKISEVLLADRLGLNEPWIDRWEENGEWKEESCAPDQIPDFIREGRKRAEVQDVVQLIDRVVAAGCERRVVYFCLAQLSPAAEWARSGGDRQPILTGRHAANLDEDVSSQDIKRKLGTREDLALVASTAAAARKQIRRRRRELLLVADAANLPLPGGLTTELELSEDALTLLENSLRWVGTLAEVYSTPFEATLVKSKGLLYLICYLEVYADEEKLRSSMTHQKDSRRAGADARAKKETIAAGNVLASLVSAAEQALGEKGERALSDLREKVNSFKEDHPKLYEALRRKLDELHTFESRRQA